MSESSPAELVLWAVETWCASFAESIETMAGERPTVSHQPGTPGEPGPGALWWQQPLSLGPEALVWVGAPEDSWLAVGRHILASAGIEATEPADARNTYLEISSQALSSLSQAISKRVGSSVSCEGGTEIPDAPAEGDRFQVEVGIAGAEPLKIYLTISPGLISAMTEDRSAGAEHSNALSRERLQDYESGGMSGRDQREPSTLDLLMEVELPVSVSFGRAALPLKDVLKLSTGSIVELNRALSEPVEVIVNNCVIARGEVVVIEGNYGVRIHEIVSRDHRLRVLP